MSEPRIHRALSHDGTQITGQVRGDGPPLVLVPGGPADGDTGWDALLPWLTDDFTCFAVNTRGRGTSADDPDHSRHRLVEDIVGFVESIGDEVHLFGHSAGGAHALEAAASTNTVHRLALYEPTLIEFGAEDVRARFEQAFAAVRSATRQGRPDRGAQIFLEQLAMANDDELAALAAADAAVHMAPLVPVVLEEQAQSGFPQLSDLALLERVTVPVLLLHGGRTAPFFVGVVRELAARLARAEIREVAGLGHLGPEIDPEPVARNLVGLLDPAPA